MWKDFNTKFKSILKGLHDHSELVYRQANLLHVQQYQRDRTMMLQHLGKLEETNRQERYMSILKWISAAPTKLDHESACETRRAYPGTARWILQNSDLRNWKEADTPLSSILWLHGIPGAGSLILRLSASGDSWTGAHCRQAKLFSLLSSSKLASLTNHSRLAIFIANTEIKRRTLAIRS